MNHKYLLFLLFHSMVILPFCSNANADGEFMETLENQDTIEILERYIAIDNVCAWPNLTKLSNGLLVATIFNQPSHGRHLGDVECWASKDGRIWKKQGTPAVHEGMTNRMNVGAGVNQSGDMVVLASGWKVNVKDEKVSLVSVLRPWVSISENEGKDWKVYPTNFPKAEANMTNFIPFGDIFIGQDGSLRAIAYAQSLDKTINKVSMVRSDDNGKSWTVMSKISTGEGATTLSKGHNETALFYLGEGEWIAAARRWKANASLDLFRSLDDGKTWEIESELTDGRKHPAHLLQLPDNQLLLTYGTRVAGQYGVAVKLSKDKGRTWGEEKIIFAQKEPTDIGYPATAILADGNLVTVYYAAKVKNHDRYHMGSIVWQLKN